MGLNQTSLFLHDIVLNFNTNAIQATTSSGGSFINNSPRLNPSPFWIQKCEIRMGSQVIETLYDLAPDENLPVLISQRGSIENA